ncbi:RimJ/RimL family protein N-acetyltransferase [Alkalibacillus filiformis]|uniref:RimJ/RimL family protein N-acetyltransferase n=1 Tax=Alkalibacillus filiformis TaxID=200990 RepID=A0ABU0DTV5_9BACI|nr:GNAT family N-acetyltransferase [Alkalibacillus filiformis]MDQ0351891.1 RimJ/RimL family protein N-acetyltransferase [Alkalibacillus filiformis]
MEVLKDLESLNVQVLINQRTIILEKFDVNIEQAKEADMLVYNLCKELDQTPYDHILFECRTEMFDHIPKINKMMKVHGKRVVYTKPLEPFAFPRYESDIWSVDDSKSINFLSEVMGVNYYRAEKFLEGMKQELPNQADQMFTVYVEDEQPVGIVLPHIEPNTDHEGRIFWMGVHSRFLGKGYGKILHAISLERLRHDFHAKSYLGVTEEENEPMRNIMKANGCEEEYKVVSFQFTI